MTPVTASSRLNIASGFASDIGKRDDNQDFAALYLDEAAGNHHGAVAALADGVGGRKGGRVAAELSVRTFIDDYLGQSEILSPRKTAARALESINYWLFREGQKNENLKGMACAFTGVVIKGRRLHSFHVGDTRLYRLREGQLEQLTQDHRPEGSGEDTTLLSRAVGAEEAVRIDYGAYDLAPHDRLMLCSDGVHGMLGNTDIGLILDGRTSAEETAQKLVASAIGRGGDDNTTALVIDIIDLAPASIEDLDAAIARLPMLDPPSVGDLVDGFRLERQLADGLYSRVFRARDLKEPRPGQAMVVLKFPKPHTIGAESSARSAFMREAWVASRVQHMWVGTVLQLPTGRQTCLYIAQPFYVGETLEHRLLRTPKISLNEGIGIATRLAKALGSLHRAGIIHRDVKPENIILMQDGGFKLVDLGVSRIPNLDKDTVFVPGTPSYKAPEQFQGQPGDERSDIFSMGVTLYRMFTGGAYPFGEIETGQKPVFARPAPLTEKRPDLPSWLDSLIVQALAPNPDDRFQDGFEMAFKLETGAYGASPDFFRKHSWFARHQVGIWRGISLALAVALALVIAGWRTGWQPDPWLVHLLAWLAHPNG
ncbi:bifunctional protein-serine/threonine kinase/phosphatase [Asticcacaulis sp. EMRT-3]|uniref:bifunctional protein-serine/threonine kinase/phosphatase n=1 Tax=Asticcacaulis sp. EMRT-3 TaxID=3040349 RepID=UPI0024AEBF6B|nr:bifunctional protein-serine/threonine kinase/phosphatase [Asticcacaulis sp. EMRT-3]MDI7775607.1 bifunctional protein-serine/threonine kinase/phosphatase [Asticcacaulis sp. EMRT-3]